MYRGLTSFDSTVVRILLIDDSDADTQALREALSEAGMVFAGAPYYELSCATTLAAGLSRLSAGGIDLVLLDLALPDASGIDTLVRVRQHTPWLPVVALTPPGDDVLAAHALQTGAQDYLIKGPLGGELLARAIRSAIRVHRLQNALRSLTLVDGLTSLYNRRGFVTLAEPQMRLAQRTKRHFLIMSAEVQGLKSVNETGGWDEGDALLRATAETLRHTFRDSDVLARLQGGAFAALALDASTHASPIVAARVQRGIQGYNAQLGRRHKLDISLGFTSFTGETASSVEELLSRATAARRAHWQSRLQ